MIYICKHVDNDRILYNLKGTAEITSTKLLLVEEVMLCGF